MGGPVAPAATHVHSQQQSHAYTSSFNCHRSHIKERKEEEVDINSASEEYSAQCTTELGDAESENCCSYQRYDLLAP
ncbi:hypothetical protein CsSME_00051343 [Camellia sinensis var. sinensis]